MSFFSFVFILLLSSTVVSVSYKNAPVVVIFGRPGSGKTTIKDAVMDKVGECYEGYKIIGLDLDVCVPQWMRDNFSSGLYPTLQQRQEFAQSACNYVEQRLKEGKKNLARERKGILAVVSFSFVNTDLRETFRSHFPLAHWILVDTSEQEARKRIEMREEHFYKGKIPKQQSEQSQKIDAEDDNKDWIFAPVTFPHHILDGNAPPESNANEVVSNVRRILFGIDN